MSLIVRSWFSTWKSQATGSVIRYWMIHSTWTMFLSPVSMIDSLEKSSLEKVVLTPGDDAAEAVLALEDELRRHVEVLLDSERQP